MVVAGLEGVWGEVGEWVGRAGEWAVRAWHDALSLLSVNDSKHKALRLDFLFF